MLGGWTDSQISSGVGPGHENNPIQPDLRAEIDCEFNFLQFMGLHPKNYRKSA
jgi:hypothetical protein